MPLLPRVANLFSRSRVDREIEAEIQSHIDLRIEDNIAAGMSEGDARRDALLRFGNRTSTKERVASVDFALGLENIWADLRYATRQLRHSPGFAITAILTLAVAICANAVVFSVLNALVLRPLNLPNSQRLYTVEQRELLNSYPDYRDLRDRNRAFDGVAAYDVAPVGLNTGGNPTEAWVIEASGNYFDVLGVKPYLGRFFQSSDEHGPDSAPYTVLSYSYWSNHFQGDSGVIGRTVEINRHTFTIVGVAPPQFRGIELFFWPDMWTPLVDQAQIEGSSTLDERYFRDLFLIGRLKPQVRLAQASADLNSVADYLKETYPRDDDGMLFRLTKPGLGGDFLGPPIRAFMTGLMLLAGLILIAACANLGGLFSAHAADRSREIALRVALGSTRRRILRQLLTEAVVISIAGGAAGIGGSVALLRAMSAWQPVPAYPIYLPVNPDGPTYAFAVLLALLSGLLFGLAPLQQVFATAPWQVVKTGAYAKAARHLFSTREALLVIQIAACAVITTASLVAVRGLARSLHANFGFQPQNALVVNTDLNMAGYSADRAPAMQRRMIDVVAALPGVSATGLIDNLPLTGTNEVPVFGGDASDFRTSRAITETYRYKVSPGYFQAAGTTLLAGRSFTWDDNKNAIPVAIVNREFARKVFGSVEAAVGRHFRTDAKTRLQIVGVVEDGKYSSLTEPPWAVHFRPLLQDTSFATYQIVRSIGDAQAASAAVQRTIRGLDDALPFTVSTWQKELSFALFAARMATLSLGVLGVLGGLLALTGIFGLASYSVSKRLREFGIRMALGAKRSELLEAALGRAFKLLAAGSVAGLILGLLATKVLAYVVYEATPRDPLVLAGAVLAMLLLGLIATWLPAQRTLSIDPGKLLREE
jgi:predicted permease